MKKISLLLLISVLSTVSMMGQSLIISEKDGETIELGLDKLRKITFKDGKLDATYLDGTKSSYTLSAIAKMNFSSNINGFESIEVMKGHLAYSATSALAIVTGSEGSTLSIYNLGGKVIYQKSISSEIETVDLSELQKGLYLLKLDNRTIKIVR